MKSNRIRWDDEMAYRCLKKVKSVTQEPHTARQPVVSESKKGAGKPNETRKNLSPAPNDNHESRDIRQLKNDAAPGSNQGATNRNPHNNDAFDTESGITSNNLFFRSKKIVEVNAPDKKGGIIEKGEGYSSANSNEGQIAGAGIGEIIECQVIF